MFVPHPSSEALPGFIPSFFDTFRAVAKPVFDCFAAILREGHPPRGGLSRVLPGEVGGLGQGGLSRNKTQFTPGLDDASVTCSQVY